MKKVTFYYLSFFFLSINATEPIKQSIEKFKPGEQIKDPTRAGLTGDQQIQEARELNDRYDKSVEEIKNNYKAKDESIESITAAIDNAIGQKQIQQKFNPEQRTILEQEIKDANDLKKTIMHANDILKKEEVQKLLSQKLSSELIIESTKEPIKQPESEIVTKIKIAQEPLRTVEKEAGIPQPLPELPFKKPSLLTRIVATLNEGWARLNELFGRPGKAAEIYKALNNVYEKEYGKAGILYRERNNQKIAALIKATENRIKKPIEALQKYDSFMGKQAQAEVKKAINGIIQVGKKLNDAGIPNSVREAADTEIDKALKVFEMPATMRIHIEEEAGIVPAAEQKIISDDIVQQTERFKNEFATREILEVLRDPNFNSYLESVRQLELGIKNLPESEQSRALLTVSEAYRVPADAAWNKLVELRNQAAPNETRAELLSNFFTFAKKSLSTHKEFIDGYRYLIKATGRVPTTQELSLPMLSNKQQMQLLRTLQDQGTKIIDALKEPKSAEVIWNDLQTAIDSALKEINNYAVSPETLKVRSDIVSNVYGRLIDAIDVASIANPSYAEQYAKIINRFYNKINQQSQLLAEEAAALIAVKSDNTLEPVTAASPPPPPPPVSGKKIPLTEAQQTRQNMQERYLQEVPKPNNIQQALLRQILEQPKLKPVEKVVKDVKSANALENALNKAISARNDYFSEMQKSIQEELPDAAADAEWE